MGQHPCSPKSNKDVHYRYWNHFHFWWGSQALPTNYKQKPLIFRAFTSKDLCPVTTLITYLEHRLPASGDPALFITTVRPHQKASKDSISRWIKLTMSEAGINFGLFTSHSCRSASTSKAIEANIDLKLYNLKVSKLVWKFDIQKTLPLRDTARISTSWRQFCFETFIRTILQF